MKQRNEKGFTLMEMMVVIIIIGILGAIAVPNFNRVFSKNKVRGSTASVTTSLYLARMKAINTGEEHGVEFSDDGTFWIVRDPDNENAVVGTPYSLEEGVRFGEVTFINGVAVFTENGSLDKNCLNTGATVGKVAITQGLSDTTKVEVTLLSGRIRETNK